MLKKSDLLKQFYNTNLSNIIDNVREKCGAYLIEYISNDLDDKIYEGLKNKKSSVDFIYPLKGTLFNPFMYEALKSKCFLKFKNLLLNEYGYRSEIVLYENKQITTYKEELNKKLNMYNVSKEFVDVVNGNRSPEYILKPYVYNDIDVGGIFTIFLD